MPKVTELYAWVLADKNEDDEGIPAVEGQIGGKRCAMPLMGADMARAKSLQRAAQAIADKEGKELRLVRACSLTTVGRVKPRLKP